MLAYFHRQGNFLCLDQHFSLSQLPLFREIHVKSDFKPHVPQAISAGLIVINPGLEIGRFGLIHLRVEIPFRVEIFSSEFQLLFQAEIFDSKFLS